MYKSRSKRSFQNSNEIDKICFIIPSMQAGGMERVMSELVFFFNNKKAEIHLLVYGNRREIFYKIPDKIIIHKPGFKFNKSLRLFFTMKTMLFLRKKVREINPASILSFGEFWNSFVLIALFGLPYPVYISDRCTPLKKFNLFHSLLRKILYPRSQGIIAQTKLAKEIYSKQFKHKNICVIGNPIREFLTPESPVRENSVLMVGRLIESKNQDKLINIFCDINQPGWKLILVGYDHLQQKNHDRLQEIIKIRNAEDKVFLEGRQTNVEAYYLKSKIFAFTSTSEGFPNAIGEAMSAGLPVIAFDCVAGPSEMIRDNYNGFLIPPENYDEFKNKLQTLMINEELRNSFGERAAIDIQKFALTNIGEKYFNFLVKDHL